MHPPHLRSPSFPHRKGVPKVSWPPPFPGPPHAHTPLRVGCPTHVAGPFVPPLSRTPPFPCPPPALRKRVCRRDSAPTQSLPPGTRPFCAGRPTHAAPPLPPPPTSFPPPL